MISDPAQPSMSGAGASRQTRRCSARPPSSGNSGGTATPRACAPDWATAATDMAAAGAMGAATAGVVPEAVAVMAVAPVAAPVAAPVVAAAVAVAAAVGAATDETPCPGR